MNKRMLNHDECENNGKDDTVKQIHGNFALKLFNNDENVDKNYFSIHPAGGSLKRLDLL